MKKEEFVSYCKDNKKKLIIVGILLLVILGCGVGAYVMSNNEKSKSNQKVNYLDYVGGIRDWSVQKGTKEVNYLEGVTWSKEYINKVTVDDSKVKLDKEGTYDLVYKVDVKDDRKKDVAKKVKIAVISKEEEDKVVKDGKEVTEDIVINNKDENKVDTSKKNNSSNKTENSKPSHNGNNLKPVQHEHHWVAQYKTVHHKEKGHLEKRKIQDAYDEPKHKNVEVFVCYSCGYESENCSESAIDKHVFNHVENGEDSSYGFEERQIQVGTVHHEAKYESYYVVDQKAYDEKVLTGYKCSCGARK